MQRDENNHVSIKCVYGDHRSHRPVARKKADVKKNCLELYAITATVFLIFYSFLEHNI